MLDNDPRTWTIATWALIIGMSVMGGIVKVLIKIRECGVRSVNIIVFLTEIATSGLVGVASYMILISLNYPVALCAAAAGICGHMATRLIFLSAQLTDKIAAALERRIESSVQPPADKDKK